jgi:CDP-paratose 2-epimerase
MCYISDLSKMRSHYPDWDISVSLQEILEQIVSGWLGRTRTLQH